jgi:hypothetical protein
MNKVVQVHSSANAHRHFLCVFALVMGVTTLVATLLHAIEGSFWAGTCRTLGAPPDNKSAILSSLSAITTYGTQTFIWRTIGSLWAPWRL